MKHDKYEINRYYPLLIWHQCEKCKDSIKKEHMWAVQILTGNFKYRFYRFGVGWEYFCFECFPDNEQGVEKLVDYCEHHVH